MSMHRRIMHTHIHLHLTRSTQTVVHLYVARSRRLGGAKLDGNGLFAGGGGGGTECVRWQCGLGRWCFNGQLNALSAIAGRYEHAFSLV